MPTLHFQDLPIHDSWLQCPLTNIIPWNLFNKIGFWLHYSSGTTGPRTFMYGSFCRFWDGISWKLFIFMKFPNRCHGNQKKHSSFIVVIFITLSLTSHSHWSSVYTLAKNGQSLPCSFGDMTSDVQPITGLLTYWSWQVSSVFPSSLTSSSQLHNNVRLGVPRDVSMITLMLLIKVGGPSWRHTW